MKTTIQILKQILETLEDISEYSPSIFEKQRTMVAAEIERLEKCEPVARVFRNGRIEWFIEPSSMYLYPHPTPTVEKQEQTRLQCTTCGTVYQDGVPPMTNAAPTTSEGWQLVPKEPTEEMIRAGKPETEGHYSLPYSLYKAMLSAAPKPKEVK